MLQVASAPQIKSQAKVGGKKEELNSTETRFLTLHSFLSKENRICSHFLPYSFPQSSRVCHFTDQQPHPTHRTCQAPQQRAR